MFKREHVVPCRVIGYEWLKIKEITRIHVNGWHSLHFFDTDEQFSSLRGKANVKVVFLYVNKYLIRCNSLIIYMFWEAFAGRGIPICR